MRSISESADAPARVARAFTWVTFLAAAGAVAYHCLAILRPFASLIAWSGVLAILCYPLQQRLVRRTGRVALSAFITSVLTVLTCLVPVLVVAGAAVNEGGALGISLQRGFAAGGEPLARTAAALPRIAGLAGLDKVAISAWIEQHMSDVVRHVGQYTITIAAAC